MSEKNLQKVLSQSMAETPDIRRNNTVSLPWWVEILFVQIGLPDAWLRTFLKAKKQSRIYIKDNQKPIRYFVILFGLLVYVNPIVKESRNNNRCISASKEYLINQIDKSKKPNKLLITAFATRFCNGGDIEAQ